MDVDDVPTMTPTRSDSVSSTSSTSALTPTSSQPPKSKPLSSIRAGGSLLRPRVYTLEEEDEEDELPQGGDASEEKDDQTLQSKEFKEMKRAHSTLLITKSKSPSMTDRIPIV